MMRRYAPAFAHSRARGAALKIAITAVVSIAVGLLLPTAAGAQTLPYQDPTLPIATRVNDLLGRMTLDEKIGQMTQAERASVTSAQITQFRLGSVLSGGGSARRRTPRRAGPTCTTASRMARWPRR